MVLTRWRPTRPVSPGGMAHRAATLAPYGLPGGSAPDARGPGLSSLRLCTALLFVLCVCVFIDSCLGLAEADTEQAAAVDDDEDNPADLPIETMPQQAPQADRYQYTTSSGAELAIAPPQLPDIEAYTRAAVIAKIQRRPEAQVSVGYMMGQDAFKAFMGEDGRLREWASRQFSGPHAIYISGGYATPRSLARQLPKQYFEETEPGIYIARLPILVRQDATLEIPPSVKELRLSLERGAFLVSDGRVFLIGSRLTAWSEARAAPAQFVAPHQFRPFLLSWGGSQLYIADSVVTDLGYAASKAYGVAISQYSPALSPKLKRARPTGWVLNSEFVGNWYGFYCYEADDVVVKDNVYHDNIQYAIDPHDRSRRLIIAGNTTYNTRNRHGIIISREVDDSYIFNNVSYNNNESGIVVDRQSRHTVVAYNKTYRNRGNGITIYESPDNLIYGNLSLENDHHGIYVRDSTAIRVDHNTITANRLSGIYALVKDLDHSGRDLKLDPYDKHLSLDIVTNSLASNGASPITLDHPDAVTIYDVEMLAPRRELGIKFIGLLDALQDRFLDAVVRRHQAFVIRAESARGGRS